MVFSLAIIHYLDRCNNRKDYKHSFLGAFGEEGASEYAGRNMTTGKNRKREGLGPDAAGQSGDIQQLPHDPGVDGESVEELAEEGNAFEAEAVEGVELADDPDVAEVTTRQVPVDDVPAEYLDDDKDHVA